MSEDFKETLFVVATLLFVIIVLSLTGALLGYYENEIGSFITWLSAQGQKLPSFAQDFLMLFTGFSALFIALGFAFNRR